jgi:hypothetical protein
LPRRIVDCLIDTGPGSPCGSLFVDEPALPQAHRQALFTVEWGQNRVDRHPLTPSGAGLARRPKRLMDVPRGIDHRDRRAARMYLASWAGGTFRYTDPDVGYIVRLLAQGRDACESRGVVELGRRRNWCKEIGSPAGCEGRRRSARSCGGAPSGDRERAAHAGDVERLRWRARRGDLHAQAVARRTRRRRTLAQLCRTEELREFALRALADERQDRTCPSPCS